MSYLMQISGPVCFLLSPAASYIIGVKIMVDGGWGNYHSTYKVPDHSTWPMELHADFPLPNDSKDVEPGPKLKL